MTLRPKVTSSDAEPSSCGFCSTIVSRQEVSWAISSSRRIHFAAKKVKW